MSLIYERLQEKYIPELGEMFTQYNPGDERDEGYVHDPEQVKKFLVEPQNIAFVAILDDKVIGCIFGYSMTMIDEVAKEFYIYGVDIHPDYHSKGYGTEFMKYVLKWVKENGFRYASVPTGSDNLAACRCYEKAGMEMDDWKKARSFVVKY